MNGKKKVFLRFFPFSWSFSLEVFSSSPFYLIFLLKSSSFLSLNFDPNNVKALFYCFCRMMNKLLKFQKSPKKLNLIHLLFLKILNKNRLPKESKEKSLKKPQMKLQKMLQKLHPKKFKKLLLKLKLKSRKSVKLKTWLLSLRMPLRT